MKKILCPTDFSETAWTGIAYAAKFAQAMNCSLTLLHVHSAFEVTPMELLRGSSMSLETTLKQLEDQSRQISTAFKINCYADVELSSMKLSEAIAKISATYDLLVMGTNGAEDLYQFFTGSNTYNAVTKAKIPLLIVPSGFLYTNIETIVYASDYFRNGNIPLKQILPIVSTLRCDLTMLQVMEESYSSEAEGYLHELEAVIKNLYVDEVVLNYDSIHAANIADGIDSYMQKQHFDLLALTSIHRNVISQLFHHSVVKQITNKLSYPVLIIHQ
jgi:nucleotide-binding universal stress UspA family protein